MPTRCLDWLSEGVALLERLAATQADAIETASQWCAEAIAERRARPPVRDGPLADPGRGDVPALWLVPGFNPIVELSMTFHTQVVGANGQRQAMFIERMPGLAEVILVNFAFGPRDVMIVFSAAA